jgi:hypothetical protein
LKNKLKHNHSNTHHTNNNMTDTNQPTQSNDQPSDHASGVGPIEQVTRTLTADDMPIINAAAQLLLKPALWRLFGAPNVPLNSIQPNKATIIADIEVGKQCLVLPSAQGSLDGVWVRAAHVGDVASSVFVPEAEAFRSWYFAICTLTLAEQPEVPAPGGIVPEQSGAPGGIVPEQSGANNSSILSNGNRSSLLTTSFIHSNFEQILIALLAIWGP